MPRRALFYVQYLEGIGHVVRAGRIARALKHAGIEVLLVLGGNPLDGLVPADIRTHQLPPVHVRPDSYSRLYQQDGTLIDQSFEALRRDELLSVFDAFAPDILITEAYPFGRWAMHFELQPLLARAAAVERSPMIVASVRDILQVPKSQAKVDESISLFDTYYDVALVHGDPQLIRIEESFPRFAEVLDRTRYTGYVVPDGDGPATEKASEGRENFDVVVSGGGGAISAEVLECAIRAKSATVLSSGGWLALAGPRMAAGRFNQLCELGAEAGVTVERYRDNLRCILGSATLSIQRGGYNTIADLLMAGCRGVIVPDADNGQTEQTTRAKVLERCGLGVVVEEANLSSEAMAIGIERAMELTPQPLALDTNGADSTARHICELADGR